MADSIIVPMSTLCSIKSGKSDTKDAVSDGDYTFFDRSKTIKKSNRYLYDCEALIIAGEGAEFLPKHFIGKFDLHQRAYALHSFSEKIDVKYLYYYLHFRKDYLPSVAVGATVKSLRLRHFEDFPIILFPINIQRNIVAKLDAIFAHIDKAILAAEANVKNSEALFKSHLFEVFEKGGQEWTDKKLTDLATYMGRGKSKHRPRNDASLYGGNYPFIQTGDVRNCDKFITTYAQTYNEKGLAQSKLWKANTVCITIAANIAEIGILSFDACFPDSVIGINVDKEKISEDFLYLMLLFAQQRIKDRGKGSAQENINLGTFEDMHFKVAPLSQQELIVQKFNDLKASADSIRNSNLTKINQFINLKKSILSCAFNGELVKD